MRGIFTTTALASALLLGTLATATIGKAQDTQPTTKECMGENCPGGTMQGGSDQTVPKKRMRPPQQNDQMQNNQADVQSDGQVMPRKKKRMESQQQNNTDVDVRTQTKVGEGGWRFDPNRQQRRNRKSATFRFYYGGYWYPEPYWEVYSVRPRYRISCGEGRGIVAERFNRVRVVECNGGTYTYLGRSQGDTYRILLNARTGRIVGRALI